MDSIRGKNNERQSERERKKGQLYYNDRGEGEKR